MLASLSTPQDCEAVASAALEEINDVLHNTIDTVTSLDEKLSEVKTTITNYVNNDASATPSVKRKRQLTNEMIDQVTKKICTTAGRKFEATGLNLYEQSHACKVTKRNEKLYKKYGKTARGNRYVICGRVDGIDEAKQIIIEHKHRMRRFFNYLPGYEKVQLYIYMYLTDMKKGQIIQHFQNDVKSFDVMDFDDSLWATIEAQVWDFVDDYQAFTKDTKRQRDLCLTYV